MYNRARIKREVKQTIAATRPRPMWIALLYLVVVSVGASLIQSVVGALAGTSFLSTQLSEMLMSGREMEEVLSELLLLYSSQMAQLAGTLIAGSILASVVLALWQGLMGVGFSGYCLSLVKGENPNAGRIFCGFPLFGKVILSSLLVWVFTMLWTLLYTVCLVIVMVIGALLLEAVPAVGVIIMVLGYIGFFLLEIRLMLRYAMTNYILLDSGKYGLEAITESKRMMKGTKGKLFMLHLSFIGWYLLMYAIILVGSIIIGVIAGVGAAGVTVGGASMGALAGMVGGVMFVLVLVAAAIWLLDIWLQPYVNGAVARFYLHFRPQEPAAPESWPTLGDATTSSGESSDYE